MERPAGAGEAQAFVLGGNANTLAFTSSLLAEGRQITAWLVPLAWTPIGVVLGENWQRVNIAADNLAAWGDSTFSPDDERAFVSSVRDLEMLARIGWNAPVPTELNEGVLVNPDDLPDDVLEAFAHPPEALVQCAICRRSCVRDDFVWNERRLCAWDFHATVFGKRGPWHAAPYEERHFPTVPACKYVAHPLLEDVGVDAIMALDDIDEALAQRIINEVIAADPTRAHLAVRTAGGFTVLRERNATGVEP
jgi:hypothetical protein